MTLALAERLDEKADDNRQRLGLTFNQWKQLQSKGLSSLDIVRGFNAWKRATIRAIEEQASQAEYEDDLMSAVQVSRALGVGEFHVCNLLHRGKIRGVKLGRRVGYLEEDLKELVERDYRFEPTKRSPLAKSIMAYFEDKTAS